MKRKLLAMILCALTILPVILTGCAKDETSLADTSSRKSLTLTLHCITGDETTEEARLAVQDAINEITMTRYKTQIILRYYKASEYEDKMDELIENISKEQDEALNAEESQAAAEKESKRIQAIDEKLQGASTKRSLWVTVADDDDEETEEETYEMVTGILGNQEMKYPEAKDSQIDIFLVMGTEKLSTYVNDMDEFATSLTESMNVNAKLLNQYLNPNILLAGQVNGKQYAIPTNKVMAEKYTYLVLNKKYVEKYEIDTTKIKSLTDSEMLKYLQLVKENEPSVVPMQSQVSTPGAIHMFNPDLLIGTVVSNSTTAGSQQTPKNLLTAWQYTSHYITMKQFERNGYFTAEQPNENPEYALTVVEGDVNYPDTLGDEYIAQSILNPMANEDTIAQYMFAVSKYTSNVDRCMEILTYLNTNSAFRNLLQYGIEGVHYKINKDTGKLERLNHDYMMDIFATGNTFIAYPEEDMELDAWDKAVEINKTAIVDPYLGFSYENSDTKALIESVSELSRQILKKMDDFDIIAAYDAKKAEYDAKLNSLKNDLATREKTYREREAAHAPFQRVIDARQATLDKLNEELNLLQSAANPNAEAIANKRAEISRAEMDLQTAVANGKPTGDQLSIAKLNYEAIQADYSKFLSDNDKYVISENNTYDNILSTLYSEFFASLVTEMEANEDYAALMNAEEETSLLGAYNAWYESKKG